MTNQTSDTKDAKDSLGSSQSERDPKSRAAIWNPWFWVILGVVLLLTGFAVGPRARLEIPESPVILHEVSNLDQGGTSASLGSRAEAAARLFDAGFQDQLCDSRCATRLRWQHSDKRRTPLSIVYVHGFSASPLDLHPTMDLLAESMGANLLQVRLRGHGLKGSALDNATSGEWLEDVARARGVGQLIGERTVLIGMSTGGTLATLSASSSVEGLAALVLLSPNFGVKNRAAEVLSLPWGVHIGAIFTGSSRHTWTAESDIRRMLWTSNYDLQVAAHMQAVVDAGRDLDHGSIRLPILFVVAQDDRVVSLDGIREVFENIGSKQKRLVTLTGSTRHELAGNAIAPALSPILADVIADFVNSITGP
jgi:alpha-beta hydrolase superfamily lysophospholipase